MSLTTLRRAAAEAQAKLEAATSTLQAERARLVARIEEIDRELGAAVEQPRKRNKGFTADVVAFVSKNPASTIKEIQAAFPDLPAASVDVSVRKLAAKGTLTKDASVPRKFSLPGEVSSAPAVALGAQSRRAG